MSELITRLALAWPHVGFAVRHGRRTLVELAAAEDPFERVRQVVGGERAQAMLPFLGRSASGAVHGWVASPHLTFPSARQIYTYVNHRHIRDKLVSHALVAGYSTLLMHGRYPAAVLFLEVPAEEVDVNVHPAKSEVRFRRGGAVHDLISRAVQSRLREEGRNRTAVTPTPRLGSRGPASQIPAEARGRDMPASLRLIEQPRGGPMWSTPPLPAPAATIPSMDPPMPRDAGSSRPGDAASFADLRVIGQLFDGYLLCEQSDALLLIDQHAAHERVMFENLRVAYGSGLMPRQRLLVPEMVEVGPREAALLGERVEDLALLGFEIECFGGNSFHIRAVPALLGDCDPRLLLQDLADELVEVGRSRRLSEAAESVLARLACHSAVRVGQSLGGEQIRALLQAMDRIDLSGSCPHGQPAFIRLPRSDIERWFKRT